MYDDVIIGKSAVISRCVSRAREEYAAAKENFVTNFSRQDAAIMNVQRACEAAIDLGHYLVRKHRLSLPEDSKNVFSLLNQAGFIDNDLASSLKNMVGFRNISVYQYEELDISIAVSIIERDLDDLLSLADILMQSEKNQQSELSPK